MRKIAEEIYQQSRCPCCGAKGRIAESDKTCDGICHRAYVRGISRGLQIELEARADNRRPYPEPDPTEQEEALGEYLLQEEFNRRIGSLFDNAALMRV